MIKGIGVGASAVAGAVSIWFSLLMVPGGTGTTLVLGLFALLLACAVVGAVALVRGKILLALTVAVIGAILSIVTPAGIITAPAFILAAIAASLEGRNEARTGSEPEGT